MLASQAARVVSPPALPPWWPGAEGYRRPSIFELSGPASCGKLSLALLWLAAAAPGWAGGRGRSGGTFYPPAAAAAGLDLDRLVVVTPPDRRGAAEAVSLLLSRAGFDAVLWPIEWRARPFGLDSVKLSTLATRSSTTLVALVTDHRRAPKASVSRDAGTRRRGGLFASADLRLRVTGWEWTWRDGELAGVRPRVRTERLRGAVAGQAWELRLERHGLASRTSAMRHPRGGPIGRRLTPMASVATPRRPSGDSFGSGRPGSGLRTGRCPPTDHLCLATATPLGGGAPAAARPDEPADRGVRSGEAPQTAARSA